MRARDVVSSLLAPLQEQMPEVCTFAVPGLPPHAIAVLRAAVLDGRPPGDDNVPEPPSADTGSRRTLALGTGFDSHVAHRLAVDADIRRGHVKPGELQEEGRIRWQPFQSDARGEACSLRSGHDMPRPASAGTRVGQGTGKPSRLAAMAHSLGRSGDELDR